MAIMAAAATQLVLFPFIFFVFLLAHPSTAMASSHHGSHGGSHTTKRSPPPRPSPISPPPSVVPIPIMAPPSAAAALVRATCNSTTYPSLCVSALAADPSSATADLRGLSAIAVAAAASNASASATALGVGANGTTGTAQGGDAQAAVVLRTCAGKYGEARDALAAARGSIEQQNYDYAAVHVSAAADYPRVCRALFFRAQRQRSSSSPAPAVFPAELAAREAALGQLCSVALDIIALLNTANN